MAEFDPTEAAYREALLGDDVGREARHARLMAALPLPEPAATTPVARSELAWRWRAGAGVLAAAVLLLAAALVLKGRPAEPTRKVDPRLAAAAPSASVPVVVTQAEPPPVAAVPAPAARVPSVVTKIAEAKPRAELPSIVVADESRVVESAAPAESVDQAAASPPPAAPAVAPVPEAAKPVDRQPQARQAEVLARADVGGLLSSARARVSRAASEPDRLVTLADSTLLAAVNRADPRTARAALQAGASVHLRDAEGRTVMMLAARTGSREVVELLLGAGARTSDRDPQGLTAADHALAQGHSGLVDALR